MVGVWFFWRSVRFEVLWAVVLFIVQFRYCMRPLAPAVYSYALCGCWALDHSWDSMAFILWLKLILGLVSGD